MNSDHRYRIILADDHALVRKGIKRVIEEDPRLQVIGEASDGVELLKLLDQNPLQPHLVVCDIAMPRLRGLEACIRIKKLYPHIKVLILSMHKSKEYLIRARDAGVDGYLLKEDADTALHTAIREILGGKTFFSALLSD